MPLLVYVLEYIISIHRSIDKYYFIKLFTYSKQAVIAHVQTDRQIKIRGHHGEQHRLPEQGHHHQAGQ